MRPDPPVSRLRRRALAAWDAWLDAAGPWRRWAQCVTLLAPGLDELAEPEKIGRRRAADPDASWLAGALAATATPGTVFVLDLPAALGVRTAAALARAGVAHPAPYLLRWPYARAVLPARPLASALIAEARILPRCLAAPCAAVVLEGERQRALPGRPAADPRADNRYEVMSDELPDLAMLTAHGIGRVVDVRLAESTMPGSLRDGAYRACTAAGIVVEAATVAIGPIGRSLVVGSG